MRNLQEFATPLTTTFGQASSTAEGVTEGRDGEGTFAEKEGIPKDEVELAVVAAAGVKMLELG
jgi:hypothetical protein